MELTHGCSRALSDIVSSTTDEWRLSEYDRPLQLVTDVATSVGKQMLVACLFIGLRLELLKWTRIQLYSWHDNFTNEEITYVDITMLSCMKYCKVWIMNVNNFTNINQQKEQPSLDPNNSTHKPRRTTIYSQGTDI